MLRSGLTVRGLEPVQVGEIAAAAGVALSSLQRRGPALEEVFLDLVNGTRVHPSAAGAADGVVPMAAVEGAAGDAGGAGAGGAGVGGRREWCGCGRRSGAVPTRMLRRRGRRRRG